MDCSLPDSPIHGILQARALEWGAIAFSDFKYLGFFEIFWDENTDFFLYILFFGDMYISILRKLPFIQAAT